MAKASNDTLERLNELRALAAKNSNRDDGLMTVSEMARTTGRTIEAIRKLLHQADELGCLVYNEKIVGILGGRSRRQMAYKILPLPTSKKTRSNAG